MSKKTTNKAEAEAVNAEVKNEPVVQAKEPQKSEKTDTTLYPFEDFYAHPEVIGSTQDMVWAAFHHERIIGAATKEQAKKLVKEFAERKVDS